jgi:peptidoglycan-associated lipoprotein
VPQAPAVAVAPPSPVTFREHPALQDLLFDFDSYEIRRGAAGVLNRNVEWLKAHPSVKVLIEGHCDERGTTEYNLALGERRAKSTQNYLMVHGIQADRIAPISYGKERPLCTERAETCWAKNRRAHFLIKE